MQTAYSGQFNGIHSRKTISMLVQERPESIYYCVQELKIPTLTQRPELSYMKRLSLDMNSIDLLPTWQAFIYI